MIQEHQVGRLEAQIAILEAIVIVLTASAPLKTRNNVLQILEAFVNEPAPCLSAATESQFVEASVDLLNHIREALDGDYWD